MRANVRGMPSYTVDWGDGSQSSGTDSVDATHTYAALGTYTVNAEGDTMLINVKSDLEKPELQNTTPIIGTPGPPITVRCTYTNLPTPARMSVGGVWQDPTNVDTSVPPYTEFDIVVPGEVGSYDLVARGADGSISGQSGFGVEA